MKNKIVLIAGFWFLSFSANAQFEVQGVFRPRFEFRNGYSSLRNDSTTPAAFISQRTRLNLKYKNEKLETKLSLFDFRVWGDQVWKRDVASFGLHEGWAKISFNDLWSVKFGRQELNFDNSRLISPVNWNQIGAAHDALSIKFNKNGLKVETVSAWNQSSQNTFGTSYIYSDSFYKSLNILWFSKVFNKFTISSLNIADGYEDLLNPEIQQFRFTYGLIPEYQNENFHATGRVFGQTGKLQNRQNIIAYYTNIDLSILISEKLRLTIGNELKSGNNSLDSLNNNSKAFEILYGARHKFNGHMDYFSTASTTKAAGLIDSYLKVDFQIVDKGLFQSEYHYLTMQNNYLQNGIEIDNSLGHEVDFVYKHKIGDDINLEAGYSVIFGTESMEIIKEGNNDLLNQWFYLMITIDPTFFSTKKMNGEI